MSKLRETRRMALAAVGTAVALGALATSAQAATTTATYTCRYPLLGFQPVTAIVEANLPETAEVGVPTAPIDVTTTLLLGGDTAIGFSLFEPATIEGTINTGLSIGPVSVNVVAPVPVGGIEPDPGPVNLSGVGQIPAIEFSEAGPVAVALTNVSMNLTARDAAGEPIPLPPVRDVVQSDDDPNTFDVRCVLAPEGQNTSLGSIAVGGAIVPGAPVVSGVFGPKLIAGVGGTVQLRGSALGKVTKVTVGTKPARILARSAKSLIIAAPPQPAGSYPVVATNAKGSSAPVTATYVKRR